MKKNESQRVTILSPVGEITLFIENEGLNALRMGRFNPANRLIPRQAKKSGSALLTEITHQLQDYFNHADTVFDLPLNVSGTEFQKSVWRTLSAIPAGEVRTYGEIARQLGSHPRAVGMACRNNPTPIIVPCHRVVAANGLGGFDGKTSGSRLALKQWLLEHEGVAMTNKNAF